MTRGENTSTSRPFFSAGLSTLQSTYPEELVWEKRRIKHYIFSVILDNWQIFLAFWPISFRLVRQNSMLHVCREFLRDKKIGKDERFQRFWSLNWNSSAFWQILFGGGLSKLPSTCPSEHFEGKVFLNKRSVFCHIRTRSEHFQP